jgi:hypothetical protein
MSSAALAFGRITRDKDLTKNASQGSINQQIFPHISGRFLSELSELSEPRP